MADPELVRIEIGFQGGDMLAARVPAADAEALERALRNREDAVCELHAEDARYLVVLARVFYVRRLAREAKVGFSRE